MDYINKFLKLRCAGDVLNVVNPLVGSTPEKLITKAMAIAEEAKQIALKHEGEYTLVEIDTTTGLVGTLASFSMPIKKSIVLGSARAAYLKTRRWEHARFLEYFYTGQHAEFNKAVDINKDKIIWVVNILEGDTVDTIAPAVEDYMLGNKNSILIFVCNEELAQGMEEYPRKDSYSIKVKEDHHLFSPNNYLVVAKQCPKED